MSEPKYRVAILISGRGSNMVRILEHRDSLGAEFVGVVSSRGSAPGLQKAADQFGLPVRAVEPSAYPSRDEYDQALASVLDELGANFLVLAGFMRILTKSLVERYSGQIVNIHPSLLPSFPGLDAQQQALDAGVRVTGCTVHFVGTGEVDSGPIIEQRVVPVEFGDTEESLSARIQTQEHFAYPDALRKVFSRELVLAGDRVIRSALLG